MNDEDSNKLEHLRWILDKQVGWIGSAETKSATFIAFILAIFAGLGTLFELKSITNQDLNWYNYGLISAIITAIFGLVALLFLLKVFLPIRNVSTATDSSIYFDLIVARSENYYKEEIPKKDYNYFSEDICVQIHANAQVAKIKHNLVKIGVKLTFITMFLAALSISIKVWTTIPENNNKNQICLNNKLIQNSISGLRQTLVDDSA